MADYKDKIIEILKQEFVDILSTDPDYYGSYNFILSNEQQFVRQSDRKPNNIYIVVKFLEATPFVGQTVQPINLNAIGEQNAVEVCQRLLAEFSQTYNLNTQNDAQNASTIFKQFYTGPQVINNFNEVFAGFRTLFYTAGTFLIGENSNPIAEVTVDNMKVLNAEGQLVPYKINFLSATWSFDNQLDPQAYTGTHSRTKSIAKIATFSIAFVIYVTNDKFCNTILGMAFDNTLLAPDKNATTFRLNITFTSGLTITNMPFKLSNVTGQQNIGEFPSISVAFTN